VATPVRDYRDLHAWQAAIQLAIDCYKLCRWLPREQWDLVPQIRRAARSVHANIAEGNGRFSTPDYLRHLSMSNASLRELQSDLLFLIEVYPTEKLVRVALNRTYIVAKLLMRLVNSLRRKQEMDGKDKHGKGKTGKNKREGEGPR
jgi:four helix bundle protein